MEPTVRLLIVPARGPPKIYPAFGPRVPLTQRASAWPPLRTEDYTGDNEQDPELTVRADCP